MQNYKRIPSTKTTVLNISKKDVLTVFIELNIEGVCSSFSMGDDISRNSGLLTAYPRLM